MNIALVGTSVSSALSFRKELVETLVSSGHKVWVFCVDYDHESRQKVMMLGATPVQYSLSRTGMNPFRDIRDVWQLKAQLESLDLDVVFSYFVKPVIYGTLAAALAGVRRRVGMLEGLGYVFTELPSGISKKQKILRRIQVGLYRLSFAFLDRLIFLNPDDQLDLLGKYQLKVRSINVLGGIGLDLEEYPYSPLSPLKPVSFIFIGRLLVEKGVYEYLRAARIVKESYPDARFVLLGGLDEANPGGLSKKELEEMVSEGVVEYPGYVDNVKDWLSEASVFVLPSYREGFPRSSQEAMAVGRALITSDVPGCRQTVVDGVNGFIVPPWNAKALAEKMICMIENPEGVKRMGDSGYRIAQDNYDANEVSRRLMELIIY